MLNAHPQPAAGTPLLEVLNLTVSFPGQRGELRAVDRVSFRLEKSQTTGIIGESGSGKSTLGRALLRLVPRPGKIIEGQVLLDGRDLLEFSDSEMQRVRGTRLGLIFQEPGTALNPLVKIGRQLVEAPKYHFGESDSEIDRAAVELLQEVGIPEPRACMESYPHELSAGMQQRALLAMALLCRPDVLVADEPTAALDSVTEFQVLELLEKTTSLRKVSLLLISHDWSVVRRMSDQILVMRQGRVIAVGTAGEISSASESYIRGLVAEQ